MRRAAAGPSYRVMAQMAGFSAAALSQAAAGERRPSPAVVQGCVRACGGGPEEWEPRWKEMEAEANRAPVEEEDDGPPPYRGSRGSSRTTTRCSSAGTGWRQLVREHRSRCCSGRPGAGSPLWCGPRLREEVARRDRPAALRILAPGPRPATTYGHLLPRRRAGWAWGAPVARSVRLAGIRCGGPRPANDDEQPPSLADIVSDADARIVRQPVTALPLDAGDRSGFGRSGPSTSVGTSRSQRTSSSPAQGCRPMRLDTPRAPFPGGKQGRDPTAGVATPP
nr:helix-turn-helix domain-containing protein [Streptomyces sp. ST1015]